MGQGEMQASDAAPLRVLRRAAVQPQRRRAGQEPDDFDVPPQSTLVASRSDRLVKRFLRGHARSERRVGCDEGEAVLDFLRSEQAIESAAAVALADTRHAMDLDEIDTGTDDHGAQYTVTGLRLAPRVRA